MKLLPRRPVPSGDVVDVDDSTELAPGTKGRPTPKRRDAAVVRGPVTAPKTRKEAYARQRQQNKANRATRSSGPAKARTNGTLTAQQRRAALRAGDPAALPRRDQGPTRKLARDYVDSHRMASNYLLVLFPLMVVGYVVPVLQIGVVGIFVLLVGEWFLVGRRIRALAIERSGSAQGSAMSIGFYAGSRAYLPRRWRLPAPVVGLGDAI